MVPRLLRTGGGGRATRVPAARCHPHEAHCEPALLQHAASSSGRQTDGCMPCRPQQLAWRRCRVGHRQFHTRMPAPALSASVGGRLQQPEELPLEPAALHGHLTAAMHQLEAVYRFTRPHTMLGTAVSVSSVSLLALGQEGLTRAAGVALTQALVAALLMNVCIVGINQMYDIEVDKINKPYLPLAAGSFTSATAAWIVTLTGAVSLAIGVAAASPPLLATLVGSLLLGLAYSADLPLLRWKRHPVAAAACILAVRAVLVQLGFFFHMQLALGCAVLEPTRPVIFATCFMLVFSIVIALFKDIPDVAGDAQTGVRTLSVRLGQSRVFWACIALLEGAYAVAVAVGLTSAVPWSRAVTAGAHTLMGALVLWRAKHTDLTSSKSIYACYMDIWKAFYAEYLLLPFFR